jgi:hypothetical protein
MRVNTKIIELYECLQREIPTIIDAYGMTKRHVYENIGMSKPTFDRKIRDRSFTVTELRKVADLINK